MSDRAQRAKRRLEYREWRRTMDAAPGAWIPVGKTFTNWPKAESFRRVVGHGSITSFTPTTAFETKVEKVGYKQYQVHMRKKADT
jgi:hypothetical protein